MEEQTEEKKVVLTIPEFKEQVGQKSFTVTFTKKDGAVRVMKATLNEKLIEEAGATPKGTSTRKVSDKVIPVYDTEAEGWRSVTLDKIIDLKING